VASVQGALPENDDVFSSVAKMEGLVHQENAIVNYLDAYLKEARARLDVIDDYVATYRSSLAPDVSSSASLVANPVDAYLLLKRLTIDWDVIERVLNLAGNSSRSALNHVIALREKTLVPSEHDLHGAAIALVRLQDTYQLNVTHLAEGYFQGVDHSKERVFRSRRDLSARDCLFLAQHAFARGYYDKALQWAQTSLTRADDTPVGTVDDAEEIEKLRRDVHSFVQHASRVHDDVLERKGPHGADWQTNAYPVARKDRSINSEKYASLLRQRFVPKLYQFQTEDEESEHYERLCRGERLRSPKTDAPLRCRLMTRNLPYLTLQPLKMEEKSIDPAIVVFHDLLTVKQTEILRQLGEPKLATSMHRANNAFVRSMVRTSKNAWVLERENASLPDIRRRMELATGLIIGPETASEHFQIANYGIGGLYQTHTDNVIHLDREKPDPWNTFVGDRIATLMVYVSEKGKQSGVGLRRKFQRLIIFFAFFSSTK